MTKLSFDSKRSRRPSRKMCLNSVRGVTQHAQIFPFTIDIHCSLHALLISPLAVKLHSNSNGIIFETPFCQAPQLSCLTITKWFLCVLNLLILSAAHSMHLPRALQGVATSCRRISKPQWRCRHRSATLRPERSVFILFSQIWPLWPTWTAAWRTLEQGSLTHSLNPDLIERYVHNIIFSPPHVNSIKANYSSRCCCFFGVTCTRDIAFSFFHSGIKNFALHCEFLCVSYARVFTFLILSHTKFNYFILACGILSSISSKAIF